MATTTKWTTKDDQRYGELYRLIIAADATSNASYLTFGTEKERK